MTAESLLHWSNQVLVLAVFVAVLRRVIRRPGRANADVAILFGNVTLLIALRSAADLLAPPVAEQLASTLSVLTSGLAVVFPYLLLRLVADFSTVPAWLRRGAVLSLVTIAVAFGLEAASVLGIPIMLLLLVVTFYFVGLQAYGAIAFFREARRSAGVTRRRLESVGLGSVLFGVSVIVLTLRARVPALQDALTIAGELIQFAAVIAYLLGFATPSLIRRAWQEPELRSFLRRAGTFARLPDTRSTIDALVAGAAASVGAPHATIGIWDGDAQILRFANAPPVALGPEPTVASRAFVQQRPIFAVDAPVHDRARSTGDQALGACAILAAPITAGDRRLGVLLLSAERTPVFAEDDLELVRLLADQAAVVLEGRLLIDDLARLQARAEAVRAKDDFLAVATNDLKTPLATLVIQAQLLEGQARRDPGAPVDRRLLAGVIHESRRLSGLVHELLDVARLEQGRLLGERRLADLTEIARDAAAQSSTEGRAVVLTAAGPIVGMFDAERIKQLLVSLVDVTARSNPDGGAINLRVWQQGASTHLTIESDGGGIPIEDLAALEHSYWEVDVEAAGAIGDRLSLYLARGIVDEHGGTIQVEPGDAAEQQVIHLTLPAGGSIADG